MTLIALAFAVGGDPAREAAERALASKVSVDFRGTRLEEAVACVRETTKLPLVVEAGKDLPVRLALKEVSARSALKLMLEPHGLRLVWRQGAAAVVPRDRAEAMVTRIYDARGLIAKLPDFAGPGLELAGRPRLGGLAGLF